MFEKIVRLAFEKASENTVKDSLSAKSKYILAYLGKLEDQNKKRHLFTAKTYERYYNKYVLKIISDFDSPSDEVFDSFAEFLGFIDFNDFKTKNTVNIESESKKTKSINEEEVEEGKVINNEKINIPTELVLKSKSKLLKLVSISFTFLVLIACVWLVIDLFSKDKLELQPTTVIYNSYNGNLNYYYTTKKDGEILLYNDSQPKNNPNLKPVTQEVMLAYFKQQQVEVTNEDQKRWFKVNLQSEKEEVVNKIEALPEKVVEAEKPLIAETKVIIKNNEVIDTALGVYFENNYTKTTENYTVTGNVIYTFRESSLNKKLVVCNLSLTYSIWLNYNQKKFDSVTINVNGSGFSEIEAKQNAISKIIL